MPKALKHFLLQGMILLLWLLFVIFPITDTRVEAQASCVNPVNYKYLSPNPGVVGTPTRRLLLGLMTIGMHLNRPQ